MPVEHYYTPGRDCWVRVEKWEDDWEVTNVFTRPNCRGNGLARQLMQQVCADADAEGVSLLLSVGQGREGGPTPDQLFGWYTRLGFHGLAGGSADSYAGARMERPPNSSRDLDGENTHPAQKAQRSG
jgi:ribosomal protein S18 acetylase RimI-like enzyme